MKNVRKLLCAALAALSMFPFGIFAAAEGTDPDTGPAPTVTVGTASGSIGDTVDVEVSLENNPGFTAFVVGVEFDHTQLTLLKGQASSASGVPGNPTCSDTGFAWLGSSDFYGNGPFVILKFQINRGADEGVTIPVRLVCKPGNICNYNEQEVKFTFVEGSVEIVPHEHSYEIAVTDPTCEEQGFTTHTCSVCGDSYVDIFTDALGHDFGEWTVTAEPTCTAEGVETRYCSRCDATETRPIEAPGHVWNGGEVKRRPTETETGVKLFICTVCGETKEEEIPVLDYLRGDINGDGAVDTKDLTRYQKYLADGLTPVVEKALDVNGDGEPGVDDLIRLLKYLAGYDVELF